ncbi:MAG: hypothetical protein ACM30H_11655 [Clostridia bacterium]
MRDRKPARALARAGGLLLFFAGLYFLAQAYTMAFHGIYIDCFAPDGAGCSLRQFSEPTLTSALYGTVLAAVALVTFYLGARALRWVGSNR